MGCSRPWLYPSGVDLYCRLPMACRVGKCGLEYAVGKSTNRPFYTYVGIRQKGHLGSEDITYFCVCAMGKTSGWKLVCGFGVFFLTIFLLDDEV